MKILQLCNKPPLPAIDGGCIAMNNITQGLLNDGHKVKILTIFTPKHDFNPHLYSQQYLDQTNIEGVFVDTNVNIVDAFASFMTSDSYNITRFFSPDFDIKLTRLLKAEKYDVVHLESLFMTPYLHTIRRYSSAPVVLRAHNVEYVIWEKLASGKFHFAKKTYLKYLSAKLKRYELSMLSAVNGIAAISDEDVHRIVQMGIKKPLTNIPFGIDLEKYIPSTKEPEMALFHIGSMEWSPNVEGIRWFLENVWSLIHERYPTLKLYLAGKGLSNATHFQYPNVVCVGEVENAVEFMNSKSIMIVPLLSAGGIRVKIIEGLALQKAIISTPIGADGIHCENGKHLFIAQSPEEWIQAIDQLVSKPELIKQLGKTGRHHVESTFDNRTITQNLVQFYKELRKK